MQHDHVLKKLNFDQRTIYQDLGIGGCGEVEGVCGQNVYYHVSAFDMQHDHVLKKFNFGLLTQPQGQGLVSRGL